MKKALLLSVAGCLATASLAQAHVLRPQRTPVVFDAEADCSAAPPAAHSVAGITDDGREVGVEVAVLLDGVKKSRARELLEKAAGAYAELGVDLVPVSFQRLRITTADGGAAIDGGEAIGQARAFFGGQRPQGADLVHLLTDKDITLPQYGNTPAGAAECAGGVQWPDKAFSVSEDPGFDAYSIDAPALTNVMDAPAEALAHELGHLLGGLHQYASCAEGARPEDATNRDPSPCTVMSDVVDVASLRFGTVESAVIRGYALQFADS
jgi:hypothetical protein